MEIQEQLLFTVTEIVSDAGAEIAFPSQTMYMANAATVEARTATELAGAAGDERPVARRS
jgi:hypothetical protein